MKNSTEMNWETGTWNNEKDNSSSQRIVITGDWAPIRHFEQVMADEPKDCYGDTLNVLNDADLRIVNLECTMKGKKPVLKGGPNLKGTEAHMECLKTGGFEIATLGNNHVFDYGYEGFQKMVGMLDEEGIKHLGAGKDADSARQPLIYNLNGIKIGIINFTEGHDLTDAGEDKPGVFGWKPDIAREQIIILKETCDLVFPIIHAGVEFSAYPSQYAIDTYRMLADEKPDAVIAHHPHVPQGIEFHNEVPIFYSLGNYLFYQETNLFHRKQGYLLELSVSKQGLQSFKVHPYGINDNGVFLLKGQRFRNFMRLLEKLSAPLAEHAYETWHGVLKARWNSGFAKTEFEKTVELFKHEPLRAAAVFRNRMTTLQHTGLYIPMFDRVVNGVIDDAPDYAYEMENEFQERVL